MKRHLTLLVFLCLATIAIAQNHQYIPDTAALIVDRYLRTMNVEAQRTDSMLYVETITVRRGHSDTTIMKRWFFPPQCMRVEIYQNGNRISGYRSNGRDVYRVFKKGRWNTISPNDFFTESAGYDFRGPLYNWRINGVDLTYKGEWDYNGHPTYRVLVQDIFRYDRYYLFDQSNNLMFLADELPPPADTEQKRLDALAHIDWRAVHEYLPFRAMVLPTIESYQYNGSLYIQYHTYSYLPVDMRLFNK
ncbi:MAG: hypothetical protein Q4D03_03440 [Bacteroidales bacterium]|nr:hypothetical protein [Bacteroidales bacterium]